MAYLVAKLDLGVEGIHSEFNAVTSPSRTGTVVSGSLEIIHTLLDVSILLLPFDVFMVETCRYFLQSRRDVDNHPVITSFKELSDLSSRQRLIIICD